ncbi:hypothetical protein B0H13DRAFT_1919640, partial [Mycena leptocephala]
MRTGAGELGGGVGRVGIHALVHAGWMWEWVREQVSERFVPSEVQGVAAKPSPDDQACRELPNNRQPNRANIGVPRFHEVGIVRVTIGTESGSRLEIERRGFSGDKATVAHLVAFQSPASSFYGLLEDVFKFLGREQLEGFAENSAVSYIGVELGLIRWAEEAAGLAGRYQDHREGKRSKKGTVDHRAERFLFCLLPFWFRSDWTMDLRFAIECPSPPPQLATMTAKNKNTNTKPKEMFEPYDTAKVPDSMPFPQLAWVGATKGQETAVPKLNKHQRSWIHDVGLRGIDLPSLKGKAATEFYDNLKTDAFDAKAFQHTLQDSDKAEEVCLPALVATWKQKHDEKNKNNSAADDDDASDQEEDMSGQGGLLRGYTKAGWRK